MGQLVTTVVGGAAGFLIGGPLGAQIGMTLGGMIGSTLFGPTIKGPRLNDLKVSASTYGVVIPEVWGTVRVGGNMIWTTGINETKKTSRAGKGGPKQTTYSYDASFAMGICAGEINDLLRIWADGKLIYDVSGNASRSPSSPGTGTTFETVEIVTSGSKKKTNVNFRLYRGTETQLPDGLIEADKGVGNVSAHRGMAYIVFENLPLEQFGNRIPQLQFEVTKTTTQNLPNVLAKEADGTSHPWHSAALDHVPFWDLGRVIVSTGSSGTDVLDIRTMQTIFSLNGSFSNDRRKRYIPELNSVVFTEGTRNSAPIQMYNFGTGTVTNIIGDTNNSTSGFMDLQDEEAYFGNLGAVGYSRGVFINTTWRNITWGHKFGEYAEFVDYDPPFQVTTWFNGNPSSSGNAEFVGYRGANNRLEVLVYTVDPGISYTRKETENGPVWESGTGWSTEVFYVVPFEGESLSLTTAIYDPSDDSLFCIGRSDGTRCVFKWQRSTNSIKFARKHTSIQAGPYNRMAYSRLNGGTFVWGHPQDSGTTARFYEVDLQTGELLRTISYGNTFGNAFYGGLFGHWDDVSKALLYQTRDAFRMIYFGAGAEEITVGDVVREVCLNSGVLTDADINVTGINADTLVGYVIDRETTARDVIKQLATGFLFDGYESDYQLKFKSRGSDPELIISEDYLGRDDEGRPVKETKTQELEMPMRVTVNYYDSSRDSQQGSQTAKRLANPVPTMFSAREDIIELPITWTPDEAKQSADKILKMQWANRERYGLMLPWRYLIYDPTDVVNVALDNGTLYTMRLSEVTIGADFAIEAQGISEKASAYVSTATGAVGEAPAQTVPGTYDSYPVLINTPLLRDEDYDTSENSKCYVAADTDAIEFDGAAIFMDDGYDFQNVGVVSDDIVAGVTLSALPDTKSWASTDNTTVLEVRLTDTDALLESVTQEDMLNNFLNAALVGNEVIQFRDATLNDNGKWELSGILRARRGTNYAVNGHVSGEQFIMLDANTVSLFSRVPSDYNVTRNFHSVPSGGLIEDSTAYEQTLEPRDLMPYTPENVQITDDDTDVTITMARRSRVSAELEDGTGDIHYKEGDMVSARITYSVWAGKTLDDTETFDDPNVSGNIALFDSNGNDLDLSLTFPLTDLGGQDSFLIKLTEIGIVDGTPKWIVFTRLGQNRWNYVDLY